MKKYVIYYYSGAGNTKYIAKELQKQLLENSYTVDLIRITKKSIAEPNIEADNYIIGFPVYDLSAPSLVTELLRKIRNKDISISYFCTKAFMSVDAILELHKISSHNGLKTIAVQDFYMPGTDALALFAKKDSKTETLLKFFHSRNIPQKVSQFILRIENKKEVNIKTKWYTILSFLIPQKIKQNFHDQYTKYVPLLHSKEDTCIKCMLCVKGCPQENIRLDQTIKFDLNCDLCLKCLHHCPVDSIQLGKMTEGNVRYKKVELT